MGNRAGTLTPDHIATGQGSELAPSYPAFREKYGERVGSSVAFRKENLLADIFENYSGGLNHPFRNSELVDISSGDFEFSNVTRAIARFGSKGEINLRLVGDDHDIMISFASDVEDLAFVPLRVQFVRMIDTSATEIWGFW